MESGIFSSTSQSKLENIDTMLTNLKHLLVVLRSDELLACGLNSNQMEVDEELDKISTAVARTCATLPMETTNTIEYLWSREVGEIQDMDVLAAIRAARNLERYR
jgi:phosphate uptake regulator